MGHFISTNDTAIAEATARLFFDLIVPIHAIPTTLISDRDPQFMTPYPTSRAALPCPALHDALPCWLRTALPCPSCRLACRVPPCPARAPPCWPRAVLPCPRAALLAAELPCPAHAPLCWLSRRPALPARRPAGRRVTLICPRALP
ncbi:unnamed protein product [Closterium sp. NIES-54]